MEAIYENHNFISVCEFLPNHLYFVTVQNINNGGSCDAIMPNTEEIHYFNTDNDLVYHNFYGDFGPLSITCLYKFCKKLTNKLATYAGEAFYDKFKTARFGKADTIEKLQDKFVKKKVVVYYTSTNNEKRANAAFLIAAFSVLYLGYSPKTAYKALQPNKLRFRAFQDASIGFSPYKITMKDCLDALHKASVFGFFNFNDFNASECSYYENIEHGDLNWIIPQKFIALPGPVEEKNDYYHHPNFYMEYFLSNNVTDVVRLNQRAYDQKCFTMFNIKHHDLYMQDGTDPPDSILKSFMHIAETASGAIAVHCKAGLGRTGSLIGAYLLKHYRMTAKEAIAWIRICRPGSVIGHQQTWLENHEECLWYEGNEWRFKMYGKTEIVPFLQYGIYSFESAKKEYPGLRDLLTSLTKRARYRFIAKNRTKKSKTRLQQMIKTVLENGRTTKSEKSTTKIEKSLEHLENTSSFVSQDSQTTNVKTKLSEHCKNLQFLKFPPQPTVPQEEQPAKQLFNYECTQQEFRKPLPPRNPQCNEYEPVLTYQRPSEYSPSNFPNQPSLIHNHNPHLNPNPTPNLTSNPNESKLQAMYTNPNSFCFSENEYAHINEQKPITATRNIYHQQEIPKVYSKNEYSPINNHKPSTTTRNTAHLHEIPKAYSESVAPMKMEKMKTANLSTKSIDRNWKQNPTGLKYDVYNRKHSREKPRPPELPMHHEVCAFDTREDNLTQYSRFNKPFLNKSYMEQPKFNMDNDYYSETKIKGYDYTNTSTRSPHGFLLSPDDLQSWVETFDEKVDETQGDKPYTIKRTSVT